jgi:ligand-binding sensor domain-containing protein
MYSHNWKNNLIIKLTLGILFALITGCISPTKKTSEPINTDAMVSTTTYIPLQKTIDITTSTHLPKAEETFVPPQLLPCIAPAPTDISTYKYPLPMFSTTWSLPDIIIYSIAMGPKYVQWFATNRGVLRFESGTWTQFTTADGLPNNDVVGIQIAPNGMVWVISVDGRISNYDGEIWRISGNTGENSLAKNTPYYSTSPNNFGMAIASNGEVWAIGLGGIYSFDGKNWKHQIITINGEPPVENYKLVTMASGPDGKVWFSAMSGDGKLVLLHYDGIQWTLTVLPDMPRINFITSIALPHDGSIWVGGNGGEAPCGLLAHYDGTIWKTYSTSNGMADDYINNLALAADGIWFTTPSGVYRFDGKTFETISNSKGYYSIAISTTDEVWLGGNGEVTRILLLNGIL